MNRHRSFDCRGAALATALILVATLAPSSPAAWASKAPITTESLLADMIDLAGMARFPAPAYVCRQFSSYDRASKSPTENWFANGDCGHYLRVERVGARTEHVMMDVDGPGAIVRIWSANPAGTLRIYLDGADQPALESPMNELLGGRYPGLPRPIAGEYSKGWNLYFPIPFAKHCKVTSDQGNFYYHVNYRLYPAATPIESFTRDQIPRLKTAIDRTAARLAAPDDASPDVSAAAPSTPAAHGQAFDASVAPGQVAQLAALDGPRAITTLRFDWKPSGDRDEPALRSTVLEIEFDGQTTVAAPLGDFFGTAPGLNPYQSLPLSVARDGRLACRWFMPFESSAQIRVRNLGAAAVDVRGELVSQAHEWTDATMLFHAKWRTQFDIPTEPKIDWNYATLSGRGVFAGVALAIDNPVKAWWGEGDEKIYVDGETFPSHFGTGTEDYFGYAWCFPGLFTHAYHNQPRCDGPGNYGRTSVNRWHILDRIPFSRDFRFDMELWHWRECRVNMSVMAYWYARPGGGDAFPTPTAADVAVRDLPVYEAPRIKGAIEGESMAIVQRVGQVEPQEWDGTSGGYHLWWRGGQRPGDTLTLGFPVEQAGRYQVSAQLLKAVDYGVAQIAINGQAAGEPIDFFNQGVILTGLIPLGTFELKAGQNTISFTITGANAKAVRSYMVGLDCLVLTPAP